MQFTNRRNQRFWIITACAFCTLVFSAATFFPALTGSAAGLAAPGSAAPGNEQTILQLQTLDPTTGALLSTSVTNHQGSFTGYNFVRQYAYGSQAFLLLLDGNKGKATIQKLDANAQLTGTPWLTFGHSELLCTAADVVTLSGFSFLVTHDAYTGTVRRFLLHPNGSLNLDPAKEFTELKLKDKNVFSAYVYQNSVSYFALDTWTGAAVVYDLNGQNVAEQTYSRGWTSVDHLTYGATTYRLFYKAAGDPQKSASEEVIATDKKNRFVIQKLTGNGMAGDNTYEGFSNGEWSTVRFLRTYTAAGHVKYSIFRYNHENGNYLVTDFNPQTGVPLFIVTAQDNLGARWTDIEPYSVYPPQVRLFTLTSDNAAPFTAAEVEKMGLAIHNELLGKAVGYQFMVAQAGRVIYSRAGGFTRLSNGPLVPNVPLPMGIRSSHSLGSVSKMMTAMTILRLADQGKLDLYAPIADYLADGDYPTICRYGGLENLPQCWVKRTKVIELLKHTSGMTKANSGCTTKTGEFDDITPPQVDCRNFFSATPDSLPCDPLNGCKWSYNNANFSALRKIIEFVINADKGAGTVQSSQDIVKETKSLWADSIRLSGLTCKYNPYAHYFGPCNGNGPCYGFNGKAWFQKDPPSPLWDEGCGAGGWSASSREMVEFLFAIRYRRIFSAANNAWLSDLLLSTDLADSSGNPGTAGLSWGAPWAAQSGGEKSLGKDGDVSNSAGLHNYLTRLPDNCDAVLLVNTSPGDAENLLRGAYKYGKGYTHTLPNY
ncbi:MAG: beta-lactamase family protein [Acidobacteria bacterium]|nr:beta-lactamase family protein [Acidobacteriota bacterium]MBI3424945.1 beta-lactamase family protein [Acidobacteriota bacterium]